MRYLAVLLLAACSSNPAADTWNTCVDAGAHVGYRLKNEETGKIGAVIEVYGSSARCADPSHPVLAKVRYE
jgi:hypothetical protein